MQTRTAQIDRKRLAKVRSKRDTHDMGDASALRSMQEREADDADDMTGTPEECPRCGMTMWGGHIQCVL